jgi:hypothetical protein
MLTFQRKRSAHSAMLSRLMQPLIVCALLFAVLQLAICGVLRASAEAPVLNTAEPVMFQGEIATGLKIQMKLFRDGSTLYGTYRYEAHGRDIKVKGTINEPGNIVLQEFVKGKVTGTFKGKFGSKERIDGKWYRPGSNKGRTFFLVNEAAGASPLAKSAAVATQTPARESREPVQAVRQARLATKLDETPRPAPKSEVPVTAQQQQVRQEVAPVTRELPLAQQDKKALSGPASAGPVNVPQPPVKTVELSQVLPKEQVAAQSASAAVAQEPTKQAVTERQIEPAENKARPEGRAISPTEKKSWLPWKNLVFNIRVVAGFGGILLLGIGLTWVAIVAGGAAGLRDSSALFHKAHALGLSFLPGVFLLALGVGAILGVFVE